jgi:hypothetical protein
MSAGESLLAAETFRVEVSGWDKSDIFSVERSDLESDNFAGRQISLNRMLADGALVVLRLLQPIVQWQPPASRSDSRHRPHQSLSLFEARRLRCKFASTHDMRRLSQCPREAFLGRRGFFLPMVAPMPRRN